MVPSHSTLKIAPLANSSLRAEQIDFWKDVYGFDMSGMLEHAFEEVVIQDVNPKDVNGQGVVFTELDLGTVTVEELVFKKTFEIIWEGKDHNLVNGERNGNDDDNDEGGTLEGFVIWFDMYFATKSQHQPEQNPPLKTSEMISKTKGKKHESGPKSFSTAPHTPSTHWSQVTCLLKHVQGGMRGGDVIRGEIEYKKAGDGARGVDLEIEWEVIHKGKGEGEGQGEKGGKKRKQLWKLE
jgi:protein arginine N-methyltransferase 3